MEFLAEFLHWWEKEVEVFFFSACGSSGNWVNTSEESRSFPVLWILEYHSYKDGKFLWSYQTNQKPTVVFNIFFPRLRKSHLWPIWTKRQLMKCPLIFFFHYSLEVLYSVRMFFISFLLRWTFDSSKIPNAMDRVFC